MKEYRAVPRGAYERIVINMKQEVVPDKKLYEVFCFEGYWLGVGRYRKKYCRILRARDESGLSSYFLWSTGIEIPICADFRKKKSLTKEQIEKHYNYNKQYYERI